MAKKLAPVPLIIARFKKHNITRYAIAKGIGKTVGTVYQWQYRGEKVPSDSQRAVLDFARREGVPLTAEEIINGGLL